MTDNEQRPITIERHKDGTITLRGLDVGTAQMLAWGMQALADDERSRGDAKAAVGFENLRRFIDRARFHGTPYREQITANPHLAPDERWLDEEDVLLNRGYPSRNRLGDIVPLSMLERCPKFALNVTHYRIDGSCRCRPIAKREEVGA